MKLLIVTAGDFFYALVPAESTLNSHLRYEKAHASYLHLPE